MDLRTMYERRRPLFAALDAYIRDTRPGQPERMARSARLWTYCHERDAR
jgi:hypothetical protein